MERRALVAAVLCMVVLLAYQEGVRHFYPQPPEGDVPAATVTPRTDAEEPRANDGGGVAPAMAKAAEPAAVDPGRIVDVETDLYFARVATTGGRLVSLRLKGYRTSIDAGSPPLEMIEVATSAAPPLGVRLLGEGAAGKVEDDTKVVYVPDRDTINVTGGASDTLTLVGTLPAGGEIRKALTFSGDTYPIHVAVQTSALPEAFSRVGLGWRHQVASPVKGDPEVPYRGAVLLVGNKLVHELATSIASEPPKTFEPPVGWAGYGDHYFLAAMVPPDPATARALVSPETNGVQILLTSPVGEASEGTAFDVYVGPKDVAVLEDSGHALARAVDFGWFSFLAVPLLRLLKLFQSVTGNYGIDIILLTILVKVLFIPLTNKSMKSMREMQRLQPQMAKLREKYADDREQLNKEMIELYRRHRVNPLGGCLPMLLQFPVFIGLYQALNQSIELRHAPFFLWIRDLSNHECYPWPGQTMVHGCNDLSILGFPVPLLVLLMGGSMLLQQWLTPQSGVDPAQQRMMMILMPVMFTVMFVNFPSGLVLYWLVNNLLTIGQQWWTNRATT